MSGLTGNEELNQLTRKVIGCLYTVSNTLGGGFLEKIYQNAAAIELAKRAWLFISNIPYKISMRASLLVNTLQI